MHRLFMNIILFPLFCWGVLQAGNHTTQTTSTITLPLSVDLLEVQNYLEQTLPQILTTIDEKNRTCLQAQYLKTKGIPKCDWKNGKIVCKSNRVKIQTVPEIKCDIEGWIKRDGNITLRGDSNTLKLLLPIKARVESLSPFKSVATAAAVLYIDIIPRINPDWSIEMQIQPSFVWSKRPTLVVLDGIKIDIQKRVEAKLQKRVDRFLKKLPQHLKKIKLRNRVAQVWKRLQKPIRLDKKSQSHLHFIPHHFSYSGFRIRNNRLETTLSIRGESQVTVGKTDMQTPTIPLAHLENIPFQAGNFSFDIPVSSSYDKLTDMLDTELIQGYQIKLDNPLISGLMTLSHPKLSQGEQKRLKLVADLHYESYTSWIDKIDGTITIVGKPVITKNTNLLSLQNLSYVATTNHQVFDTFINASQIKPLQSYLNQHLHIDFGKKLKKVVKKANDALASVHQKHFVLFGHLKVAEITSIEVGKQQLTIYTKLNGEVNASIDFSTLTKTK